MFPLRRVQVSSSRSVTSVVLVERLVLSAANGDWARVRKKTAFLMQIQGFIAFNLQFCAQRVGTRDVRDEKLFVIICAGHEKNFTAFHITTSIF